MMSTSPNDLGYDVYAIEIYRKLPLPPPPSAPWSTLPPHPGAVLLHHLPCQADRIRFAAVCRRWRTLGLQPQEDDSPWPDLPMDVLCQVMSRLPSLGARLRLAEVCRQWHATVRARLPHELCLALPDGSLSTVPAGSVFRKPRKNPTSPAGSKYYRGATSRELLFVTDDCCVYSLVNPFTGRRRSLPVPLSSGIRVHQEPVEIINDPAPKEGYLSEMIHIVREEMVVRKLVVCPDGLVAAIIGGHEHSAAKVALCAPETTWSWSLSAHDRWRSYADMVFFDGKLYTLTDNEDLLALEVGYSDEGGEPRITRVERVIEGGSPCYRVERVIDRASPYTFYKHYYTRTRYLVRTSDSGMLMVRRVVLESSSATHKFVVFRADLLSSRWVEVNTLGGDETLFVGRLCSRAVRPERHEVRSDQIFFLNDSLGLYLGDEFVNVYDMKDGRVSELLPMDRRWDGAVVPGTWLFREDPDAEE